MLRPIGWWSESLADEELPAPQELMGPQAAEVTAGLARYLASGFPLIEYRGFSWCRFLCGIDHSKMGRCDLTDGVWVWPEGLAHYVQSHSVLLPEEFVDHALSGYVSTKPGAEKYDLTDWVRWCADRRLPQVLESRRQALMAARARAAMEEAAFIEALERQQGLSAENCQWAGCGRQALAGRVICAKHGQSGSAVSAVKGPLELAFGVWLRQLSEPR